MLQWARWSAVILCFTAACCTEAWADTLTLQFSELAEYAQSQGAQAEILHQRLELAKAERDRALQWSNPSVAFDRQGVKLAEENQFTIGKTFAAPWAYLKERSSWKLRIDAALKQHENSTRRLLAGLKSGYVRLTLLDAQREGLGHLEELIPELSGIAESRRAEGHLSGVDEHLIRMILVSLHAARQSTIQSRRSVDEEWRALIGVGPETAIILQTPVSFQKVDLAGGSDYGAEAETNPGYQSHRLTEEAFRTAAAAARGRLIPDVTLYGGYKDIAPDLSGYVAGISVGIPLFNRNGAAVRQAEIRSRIASREAETYRIRLTTRIAGLIQSITHSEEALGLFTDTGETGATMTAALLHSYQEGYISLHELLNAIQIEVTGLADYYSQLSGYYSDLFELEAITGRTLVEFGP